MSRARHVSNLHAYSWDDLRVPATVAAKQGANAPQLEVFANNDGTSIDKSIRFGADDYAYIPAANDYTVGSTDAKSMSFWFKPDSIQDDNPIQIVYRAGCYGVRLRNTGGTWRLEAFTDANPYTQMVTIGLNQRHSLMVGATSVGGVITFSIVLDNVLLLTDSVAKVANNQAIYFGAISGAANASYLGLIDEIVYYQGDVTQDITVRNAIWNSGNGTQTPPTGTGISVISHWPCNAIVSYEVVDTEAVHNLVLGDGAGNNDPSLDDEGLILTTSSIGVFTYKFLPDIRSDLLFTAQVPHGYLAGSKLRPHLHFSFLDDVAGNVVWGVELIEVGINETWPSGTTILESINTKSAIYKHEIAGFGDYVESSKSAQILGRLYRAGDDSRDTYPGTVALFEFDFHVRMDRTGTLQEYPGATS